VPFRKLAASTPPGPLSTLSTIKIQFFSFVNQPKVPGQAVTRVTTKGRGEAFRQIEGQFGGWWGNGRVVLTGASLRQ
jgi:hypothetical protein